MDFGRRDDVMKRFEIWALAVDSAVLPHGRSRARGGLDLAHSAVAPLSLARWELETSPEKICDCFPQGLVIQMRASRVWA